MGVNGGVWGLQQSMLEVSRENGEKGAKMGEGGERGLWLWLVTAKLAKMIRWRLQDLARCHFRSHCLTFLCQIFPLPRRLSAFESILHYISINY